MYELPSSLTDFGDLKELCSLCQALAVHQIMYGIDDPTPSKSFEEAFKEFQKEKTSIQVFLSKIASRVFNEGFLRLHNPIIFVIKYPP